MSDSKITSEVLAGLGLSLTQAARRFPPFREDKSVAPSTVFRWLYDGIRMPDGSRLRLEAVRLGGRWLTSGPAIERFISRQTPSLGPELNQQTTTSRQRSRSAEATEKELEAILSSR
jgi:hypothetical protein